ncbi:MAG: O-antigen ligase family protein [Methylococcaceae bacterium]|nr:O-antigen ligase family protein [Methylococcaceae bacterium]
MSKLTFLLLGTYLGLSPIYWWPGVDPKLLDNLKLAMIGLAVSLVWLQALMNRRFKFPGGVIGPAGLLLLLSVSAIAISQSELYLSLVLLKDYLLGFLMLWTFAFYVKMERDPYPMLYLAAVILGAHCILVDTSKFLGVPRWSGPRYFVAPELWISGFGSLRTGWSCGVAPFVPVALSVTLQSRHSPILRLVFGFLAAAIVLSQLVVAGRAGMLASAVGIAWIITGSGLRRWLPVFAGAAAAGLFLASDFLFTAMRLKDLGNGQIESVHDLNKFSAHRIDSDLIAWKAFLDSPLSGHGLGEFSFGGGSEIHNLWLRRAVEGGGLVPLALTWVICRIWQATRPNPAPAGTPDCTTPESRFLQAIILMGLVMSMLEPRIPVGVFQLNAIWWAAAGIAAAGLRAPTTDPAEPAGEPAPPRPLRPRPRSQPRDDHWNPLLPQRGRP